MPVTVAHDVGDGHLGGGAVADDGGLGGGDELEAVQGALGAELLDDLHQRVRQQHDAEQGVAVVADGEAPAPAIGDLGGGEAGRRRGSLDRRGRSRLAVHLRSGAGPAGRLRARRSATDTRIRSRCCWSVCFACGTGWSARNASMAPASVGSLTGRMPVQHPHDAVGGEALVHLVPVLAARPPRRGGRGPGWRCRRRQERGVLGADLGGHRQLEHARPSGPAGGRRPGRRGSAAPPAGWRPGGTARSGPSRSSSVRRGRRWPGRPPPPGWPRPRCRRPGPRRTARGPAPGVGVVAQRSRARRRGRPQLPVAVAVVGPGRPSRGGRGRAPTRARTRACSAARASPSTRRSSSSRPAISRRHTDTSVSSAKPSARARKSLAAMAPARTAAQVSSTSP